MAEYDGLKTFDVRLDLKKTLPAEPIEVVAGDTGSRLEITVTDDGQAVDLDGLFIMAVFSAGGRTAVQDSTDGSMTVDGAKVTLDVRPASLAPGRVDCELQIYSSSGEDPQEVSDYDVLVTTKRFSLDCRAPLMNDEAIASLPGMPALTALLNEIAAAEQQRAEEFAELAAAFHGCITGEGAPSSALEAEPGRLYFDTSGGALYACTAGAPSVVWKRIMLPGAPADELTVTRNATYEFMDIPSQATSLRQIINIVSGWYSVINSKQDALTFDSAPTSGSQRPVTSGGIYSALHADDMTTIADVTLSQQQSSVTLQGFECGELYLIVVGGMTSGSAARVSVNGEPEYAKFSTFAPIDCGEPNNAATVLSFARPVCGFAVISRISGGDPDEEGFASSSAQHCVPLPVSGITNYTSVAISGDGQGKFPAGTRFLLKGRP